MKEAAGEEIGLKADRILSRYPQSLQGYHELTEEVGPTEKRPLEDLEGVAEEGKIPIKSSQSIGEPPKIRSASNEVIKQTDFPPNSKRLPPLANPPKPPVDEDNSNTKARGPQSSLHSSPLGATPN